MLPEVVIDAITTRNSSCIRLTQFPVSICITEKIEYSYALKLPYLFHTLHRSSSVTYPSWKQMAYWERSQTLIGLSNREVITRSTNMFQNSFHNSLFDTFALWVFNETELSTPFASAHTPFKQKGIISYEMKSDWIGQLPHYVREIPNAVHHKY